MRKILSGLLAPMPADDLRAHARGRDIIAGTGAYAALVSYEDPSIEWARALAKALSRERAGEFHAFELASDEFWTTTVVNGATTFNDEELPDFEALGVPIDV